MKLIIRLVLLLSVIVISTQDIAGRKGCDCSICKGVNKINPIVGKKLVDDGGSKSGCNLCERRKEMLRLERERQQQLQKCPFDILRTPLEKGKTSEELFDDFRELIVPSQNGFFDMMRGIVRTMHVSSVAEVNWAKEKEALELAKKRKQELEEAKKRKAIKPPTDEIVSLNNPVSPQVTVVLKQTPCGQVLQPSENSEPEKVTLFQRLPKESVSEAHEVQEGEPLNLQSIDHSGVDYLELNSKDYFLHSDIDEAGSYAMPTASTHTDEPETEVVTFGEETITESPFVKFVSNDQLEAVSGAGNFLEDFDMNLNLPSGVGVGFEEVDKENAQEQIL